MARIQLLDRQTAELIAAGEVIERPSSVVKELIENAIDAGASGITVELKNGGVRYIRVTDDGSGIHREDVPKAFLRHATSKVRDREDLYQIGTLGFRGEALASVAAVARVQLLTKTQEDILGTQYRIQGGVPGVLEDAGCPVGTTIIVEDLFYNIPARMKFLKKDVTEGNAISALMDRLALSHPEISFRLIKDGQRKLHTPGDGKLLSAIHGVYDRAFGGSLIPVDHSAGGIRIEGYITRPESSRTNRTMEHFFINGRYVKSLTMMAALEDAYKNTIMTGRFPGCVLTMALPYGMVDVNVHPAKLEVKLSDERLVYEAVLAACKTALAGLQQSTMARDTASSYQKKLHYFDITQQPDQGQQQRLTAQEYWQLQDSPMPAGTAKAKEWPAPPNNKLPAAAQSHSQPNILRDEGDLAGVLYENRPMVSMPPPTGAFSSSRGPGSRPGDADEVAPRRISGEPISGDPTVAPDAVDSLAGSEQFSPTPGAAGVAVTATQKDEVQPALADQRKQPGAASQLSSIPPEQGVTSPQPVCPQPETVTRRQTEPAPHPGEYRLIGELFQTYLLVEGEKELLLVDKHAAHERLLFNQLMEAHHQGEIPRQLLLGAMRISLDKERYDALMNHPEETDRAGFTIEDFGEGSVLVREVPALLDAGMIQDVVHQMAELLFAQKDLSNLDLYHHLYHSIACKGAIKGKSFTGREEQQKLLEMLGADPSVRHCPHGRPIMIAMTRRELETMFGRVQ